MTNPPPPGGQTPDNPWQTGGSTPSPRQPADRPGQQPGGRAGHQAGQPYGQQAGQPYGQQPAQEQWSQGGYGQPQPEQHGWGQQSWNQQSWNQQSWNQPSGQQSADQPAAQQSWNQPSGQQPAGQAYSQQSAGQVYSGWQTAPSKRQIGDANPLKAALDFSFESYATPGLVKIIYLLAVVLGALWWIGGTILMFVAGASQPVIVGYSSGPSASDFVPGILSLLLGWIPVLLWLLFIRVLLEGAMALVRTASDVRALRTDAESGS